MMTLVSRTTRWEHRQLRHDHHGRELIISSHPGPALTGAERASQTNSSPTTNSATSSARPKLPVKSQPD